MEINEGGSEMNNDTWKYDTGILSEMKRIRREHHNYLIKVFLTLFWMLKLPMFVVAYSIWFDWWDWTSENIN